MDRVDYGLSGHKGTEGDKPDSGFDCPGNIHLRMCIKIAEGDLARVAGRIVVRPLGSREYTVSKQTFHGWQNFNTLNLAIFLIRRNIHDVKQSCGRNFLENIPEVKSGYELDKKLRILTLLGWWDASSSE